jgi:hypothetical protein
MDKKTVFPILLVLMVIVALAVAVVYSQIENSKTYERLHKTHAYTAYRNAQHLGGKLSKYAYSFYAEIHDLTRLLRPENSEYNETKLRAIYGKLELLRASAESVWLDVHQDLQDLRRLAYNDNEIPFLNASAYATVFDAAREALGQIEWAAMGKGPTETLDETPAFLWALYDVLGLSQIGEEDERNSGLLGLGWCFRELGFYWDAESHYGREGMPGYLPPPQTVLDWIAANATALHAQVTQWENYRPSILYP